MTPSQRISYWAQHLYKIGIFPTIITREWEAHNKSHSDTKRPIGESIRYEIHENYEVYYLPFKPGILDRAYVKIGETALRPLFLIIKVLDVLLVNFTLRFSSYANFYPFLRQLVKNKHFEGLLISGEPFYLFKVGYYARKELGIPWVADYRDDWSTNELQRQKGSGFLRKIIFKIEAIYEKQWVRTANHVISVSKQYTNRISVFLKVPGLTIENGFEETLLDLPKPPLTDQFTVVYSGTVYPSQRIDIILEALEAALNKGRPFRLVFLGSGFDVKEKRRIEAMIIPSLHPYVDVTDRIPRSEALSYILKSHVVLGISYGNMKGIPSSKLYEYIGLKKPVLLCPTDGDIMEEILQEVGLGFFAIDAKTCLREIEKIQQLYENDKIKLLEASATDKVLKFSRFVQMSKLKGLF